MKKLILISSLLIAASLAPTSVFAQSKTPGAATLAVAMEKPGLMKDATEGEVRKVDRDAKKITLKHGPIKNLDMPGMTMVFQVKDPALLDKLAVGDRIMFTVEQLHGAMVVTGVETVAPK